MTENRVVVYYMKDASFLYLLTNPLHDFETPLSVFTFFFFFSFALPCALKISAFAKPTVGGGSDDSPKE